MSQPHKFPCADFQKTKQFYETLGFSAVGLISGPKPVMVMEKDGIVLHFHEEPTLNPFKNGALATVQVKQIEKLTREISEKFKPAEDDTPGWIVPHKNGEFHLVDLNGNLLMLKPGA